MRAAIVATVVPALIALTVAGCDSYDDHLGGAPEVRGQDNVRAVRELQRAGWKVTFCGKPSLALFGNFSPGDIRVVRERKIASRHVDLEVEFRGSNTCDEEGTRPR
ncbi:hypothetical protein DSM112329_02847 [Paraconexibacter sp. AEG42_29]|uniref:PASTA domain-containing protein n=1 Tax=Paraconexibacter sp. AEG42_29 TaxID=2997339 RepID=A0AAU7AW85_9ACTN